MRIFINPADFQIFDVTIYIHAHNSGDMVAPHIDYQLDTAVVELHYISYQMRFDCSVDEIWIDDTLPIISATSPPSNRRYEPVEGIPRLHIREFSDYPS